MMRWIRLLFCRLPCPLWFHAPEIIETYDAQTRKLRCEICGRYFAMSDRYQVVLPWDDDYERIVRRLYGVPRSKV